MASEILSEYIWSNCSNTYINECILPISIELKSIQANISSTVLIDIEARISAIESQRFTDSCTKLMQLISSISDHYKHTTLKSAKNRQKMRTKLANF